MHPCLCVLARSFWACGLGCSGPAARPDGGAARGEKSRAEASSREAVRAGRCCLLRPGSSTLARSDLGLIAQTFGTCQTKLEGAHCDGRAVCKRLLVVAGLVLFFFKVQQGVIGLKRRLHS